MGFFGPHDTAIAKLARFNDPEDDEDTEEYLNMIQELEQMLREEA